MIYRKIWLLAIIMMLVSSCQGNNRSISSPKGAKKMQIKSSAFQESGMIPKQYTGDGANISPPLNWDTTPKETKTFALIVDDPDAPMTTWVHWVIYNIPATDMGLSENIPHDKVLKNGAEQGTNGFRKIGYGGPMPPSGTHRYYFKLYALDEQLSLEPGATKDQLLKAMSGHILAEAQLMGKYKR